MFGFFKKKEDQPSADDRDIFAVAAGEQFDATEVPDQVFAQKMMGETIAFRLKEDTVTICAPANGTLTVMYPTGHAFGITTRDGVELLVHIGIDTVNAKGDGFTILKKKQGDVVKAGDPIVKVDQKKLGKTYNMSTMLIVTGTNGHTVTFHDNGPVSKGQVIGKIQ